MTVTVVQIHPNIAAPDAEQVLTLEEQVARLACGPLGPCSDHRQKAAGLLQIAHTRALDALAAAICNAVGRRACPHCTVKAEKILDLTAMTLTAEAQP